MSENNSENQENQSRPLSPLKIEENDKICWSPRFEFDAPRYTNFSSIKYRETRRLLNKLVLNQEDPEEEEPPEKLRKCQEIPTFSSDESDSEAFEDLISFTLREDSDSSDIDEWFTRFHPLHEPLRPITPPGPLISPEKLFIFKPQQSVKASPLKLSSSGGASPKISNTMNCELNTPSKGPNTRIGLRSKPARVLKSNNSNTSFDSSPSSLMRSNFSSNNNPLSSPTRTSTANLLNNNLAVSPIRTNQNFLMSSPLKPMPISTPSRLSTASNASSITLSVSSLTKTFYNEPMPPRCTSSPTIQSENNLSKLFPPNSPLKTKTKFSEGASSPLRKAVGILQLEEEPSLSSTSINLRKRLTDETTTKVEPKKHRKAVKIDADLEDIKKLLSQHNNRIRPHNNKRKS